MSDNLISLIKTAQSAVAAIRVRSALNPLLWFCLPMSVLCIYCSSSAAGAVQWFLLGCAAVMIFSVVFFFAYFAVKNPDLLRSETYNIQKQSIEMLGTKSELLDSRVEHIALIANPETRDER